ncbi:MAG: hypothetical protein R3B49_06130 [Phycisphaerales bacterium]
MLETLLDQALEHLIRCGRARIALRDDLAMHHDLIRTRLDRIAELAPGVVAEYEKRLKTRLENLLAEFDVHDGWRT